MAGPRADTAAINRIIHIPRRAKRRPLPRRAEAVEVGCGSAVVMKTSYHMFRANVNICPKIYSNIRKHSHHAK